ncbi:MAG: spondin domain-containing protein [Carboxylicivirga sp.]|jgi:hypothetical protein|nr:spondin domain-containing protein [Carboxylicivirga sp.]
MKAKLIVLAGIVAMAFTACNNDDDEPMAQGQDFKVTIENVSEAKEFLQSGVFNTPVGANEPGGAGPGHSYEFSFYAGPGHKVSFATMFVKSNDLFYAPSGTGIELYNNGTPVEGDITSQLYLWDAGTEVNEEPGTGPNQPLNGGGTSGEAENGTVRMISAVNDGYMYPDVASTIQAELEYMSNSMFKISINNLSGSFTPIAPGVFVVHSDANPLFTENESDRSEGLKELAEAGNAGVLGDAVEMKTGLVSPLAPGVFAIHNASDMPLFMDGSQDNDSGLEALAEDGNPATLLSSVQNAGFSNSGVFNTPMGESAAGPLFPGQKYVFSFSANPGQKLSWASMLVQSNDLFYAPADNGVALFNGETPATGDITSKIYLWDAGTELNEFPGAGLNQPPRQSGANTGTDESKAVMMVNDGFSYPDLSSVIRVTVSLQ